MVMQHFAGTREVLITAWCWNGSMQVRAAKAYDVTTLCLNRVCKDGSTAGFSTCKCIRGNAAMLLTCRSCQIQLAPGVKAIQVKAVEAPDATTTCFHLIRPDGSAEDFSTRKCIAALFPHFGAMKAKLVRCASCQSLHRAQTVTLAAVHDCRRSMYSLYAAAHSPCDTALPWTRSSNQQQICGWLSQRLLCAVEWNSWEMGRQKPEGGTKRQCAW